MSKIARVSIIMFIFLGIIFNNTNSYGYKNLDLFSCILDQSKGHIEEYGVKTCFETYKNGQELYDNFITQISKEYKNYNKEFSRDEGSFIIKFQDDHSKGHVEFNNEERKILVQIIQKGSRNNLQELKAKTEKIILSTTKEKIKYWIYLRAKLNDKDNIRCINENVINYLEDMGVKDVSTIKIKNGYSSTAYTGKYQSVKNGDKIIDFNFALCKYSSGNYIIIGTPEIFVPY